MSRIVRVAIVGAGLMGRWHAHAARHAGGRVTAVVDPDRARAGLLASRHGGCRVFSELGESLEFVDVVQICAPTSAHVSLTTQALAAHRHVLVEKPLAVTAADTADLLRLAERHRVLLCPVHQFLFQDGVQAALSSPVVRSLRHIDITMCSAGAAGADDAARERLALEILPHPLSLLGHLWPDALAGVDWAIRHPTDGEIRAIGQVGEVTVALLVSMSARPTVNRIQFMGARDTIHVDLFHGFAVHQAGAVSRRRKLAQPFLYGGTLIAAATMNLAGRSWKREPAYPGLRTLLEQFYNAVITGGGSPIPAAETLAVAETCDRLRAALSARLGADNNRRVTIDPER